MDEWMVGGCPLDGWMDSRWMCSGWMDGWMDGGWIDDGWVDEQMDGWMVI